MASLQHAHYDLSSLCEYMDMVPAYGHSQGLRGGGTWTDHLWLQTMRLEHIQEGITRRHRPWWQPWTKTLPKQGRNSQKHVCTRSFFLQGGHVCAGEVTHMGSLHQPQWAYVWRTGWCLSGPCGPSWPSGGHGTLPRQRVLSEDNENMLYMVYKQFVLSILHAFCYWYMVSPSFKLFSSVEL